MKYSQKTRTAVDQLRSTGEWPAEDEVLIEMYFVFHDISVMAMMVSDYRIMANHANQMKNRISEEIDARGMNTQELGIGL